MFTALSHRYDAAIWDVHLDQTSAPKRWGILIARMVHTLLRDIQSGELTMRAMGLVYTTLLSLVPMLALAFSMLKAFGVDNALRPVLHRFFAPLGAQADEVIDKVIGFVQNVQVGVLGAIGVVLLMYSVISLIQKVEAGCNYIWQVREPRSFGRRFTEYLSVLIVGPIVILAASSMTASLSSSTVVDYLSDVEPFGATLYLAGRLLPYMLYSAAFTFLFLFMPNTRVHVLPALGGGILAGVLWQTASLGFAVFASNSGNYNAIYSSFAILILLLVWLYVSWLIMLVGCRVAFLLQHPERLSNTASPPRMGAAERERIALLTMALIGHHFMRGDEPWREDRLARYLRTPPDHIHDVVDQLVAANILVPTDGAEVTLLPRQDIDGLKLSAILDAVRSGKIRAALPASDESLRDSVDAALERSREAQRATLGQRSLRELVLASMPSDERTMTG